MAKRHSPTHNQDVDQKEHHTNCLKLKLDHLKTFSPLTDNQKKFFDAYKRGDYFMALLGSPGVGKCQGEDVEVNLMVSDEMYEVLSQRQSLG